MLIDACGTLRSKLDLLEKARNDTEAVDDFRQVRDALKENSEALTSAFQTLALFKRKGISIGSLPNEKAMGLNVFFAGISAEYKNDTESIRKKTYLLYQRVQELTQLGSEVTRILTMSWGSYIRDAIKDINTGYLEVLAAFAKFSDPVNKIRSTLLEINDLWHTLPTTEEEIDSLNAIVKELTGDWESLELEGLSESVYDFLEAVRSENGADLTKLDSEVRDWITKNGLEGVFRVIIKRTD